MKLQDLGLTYEQAAHGVQTSIAYDMQKNGAGATSFKHIRTGVDMSKADMAGLAELLISKGVFTLDEYLEHLRLAANHELAMREAEQGGKITFR